METLYNNTLYMHYILVIVNLGLVESNILLFPYLLSCVEASSGSLSCISYSKHSTLSAALNMLSITHTALALLGLLHCTSGL